MVSLSAHHMVRLQDEHTALWHEAAGARLQSKDEPEDELDRLVVEQHRANFELWHEEDRARTPGASDAVIAAVKRSIDRINQGRNDLVEEIDGLLLARLACEGGADGTAELHSETPGLMIDRLSILSLKLFHTRQELARDDAPEGHSERNRARLAILIQQQRDLADCLDSLWQQVCAGQRWFKLYRQLKMYNDPALNPAMYRAGQGSGTEP